MANYKSLPKSKVGFSLSISKEDLEKAKKSVVARAQNEVSLKGFRQGHAPESMVIQSIGAERLQYESTNTALDKVYRNFVITEKLAVISSPEIKMKESKKDDKKEDTKELGLNFEVEVEVFPSVKLGDYKKIKSKAVKVEVEDKEITDVIETICAQLNIGEEVNRAAKKNDLLEVDFVAHDKEGKVLPGTKADNQKFRVGMGHYLEDLEKAFTGMKPGEAQEGVKVKFPKTYHNPDFAGNTINFDIKLHKVFEIKPEELTEAQIEMISGKKQKLEDLKAEIKKTISGNKNKEAEKKAMDSFTTELSGLVTADLPQSWVDKEITSRLERMKASPQFKENPESFWKTMGKDEDAFKKDLALEGEKDLKIFLGLSEIVKVENVELDKDEQEEAHRVAHQHLQSDSHEGAAHDAEMQKAVLNLKIDKYLRSAIMEG